MMELNDHELLRRYAREKSEEAFATLAGRYVNLVYSAALRFTGNPHQAEEITQAVYIILARKAASLRPGIVLSGWLYQTARLTAANFVKGEIRRQRREQEAYMESTVNAPESGAWEQIAPLLEEAVGSLGTTDRNAIVLRFLENKTTQEVATRLRLSEAAAHKRVSRALEKLRKFFARRGVALSATVLAEAVAANAVQAAPAGLAPAITATAVKGVAVSGSILAAATTTMKTMLWIKVKMAMAIVAGVLVLGSAGFWVFGNVKASDGPEAYAGTTQMRLTGTTGAIFTGFYVQDGQKIVLSNTVPWSFAGARISSFEFHKLKGEDTVVVALDYRGEGVGASVTKPLTPEWLWLQGRVQNGLVTQTFPNR